MSVWTPGQPSRQEQKQLIQKQQKEMAEYQKKVEFVAGEIIKVLLHEDLKMIDFNNVIEFINNRFNTHLIQTDIKEIERSLKK